MSFNGCRLNISTFLMYQIGIKADWRAHHGRIVLFLGNKNTAPLVSVHALMMPPSHLKMELSLVPDTIPPRAQVASLKNVFLSFLGISVLISKLKESTFLPPSGAMST